MSLDSVFADTWNETREKGQKLKLWSVEDALYERACGYVLKQGGKDVKLPPDVSACIAWLKAHAGDKYNQKNNVNLSGSLDVAAQIVHYDVPANLRHEIETCDSE